ncbi:uncharacterized protein LODBEIA_P32320 [Lodderomyces beijingensis]|uniref:TATA element modulatory factor 1 TATA binding domain-containing protein n=1 Tax=Lodderomyces beijingensis TaxID=1775926 RepID=A0ABP0ZLH2_9ASCO
MGDTSDDPVSETTTSATLSQVPTEECGNNIDPETRLVQENEKQPDDDNDDDNDDDTAAAAATKEEPAFLPPKRSKKRLTLQERLAQAAKGKKKAAGGAAATATATAKVSNGESSNASYFTTSANTSVDDVTATGDQEQAEPAESQNDQNDLKHKDKLELELELKKLQTENANLTEQLSLLKKSKGSSKELSELQATIAQKDETIKQLMKEGETLSHKELKLNETIKKLKSTNQTLEEDMAEFAKKHNESLVKSEELQDFLKTHKLKNVDQLISKFAEISENLHHARAENEASKSFQSKYKDLLLVYEEVNVAKQEISKELNGVKIEFEMSKKQHELDLASKDGQLTSLKNDLSHAKQSYCDEISRLEEKIEQLRLDREVQSETSSRVKADEKVDFDDFKKLSDAHHTLQKQYLNSQENWKIMESNLALKADTLTTSLEATKKAKLKISNEIQRANSTIQKQAQEMQQLQAKIDKDQSRINELELSFNLKSNDLQDLNEKMEKLKSVYNQERANLNSKVQQLTDSLERQKEQKRPEPLKFDSRMRVNSSSSAFSGYSWNDIRLGESSQTPALNREDGVFLNNSHNLSSSSFTEIGDEIYDRDQYSNIVSSQLGSQLGANGQGEPLPHNALFGIPSSSHGNSNNLQLVNKMSSTIRRLEIELHTLKDENSKLIQEKEQREQELLASIKLNDEVAALKSQVGELENTIEENKIKEQTMLELIGEKSEQVEELKADVVDLKELCRSQVQQMVELQGF